MRGDWVCVFAFPGLRSIQEVAAIVRARYEDERSRPMAPQARTIGYSARLKQWIVRSFWLGADLGAVWESCAITKTNKTLVYCGPYTEWRAGNDFNCRLLASYDALGEPLGDNPTGRYLASLIGHVEFDHEPLY